MQQKKLGKAFEMCFMIVLSLYSYLAVHDGRL